MMCIRERHEREHGGFRQIDGRMLATMIVAIILISGCWGGESGPKRYGVSGKVTYRGEPVLGGMIYFDPDGSKGNKGPQGSGQIKGGQYETGSGHGAVGGPHVVRIIGYEGGNLGGDQLFPTYTTEVDLPKEAATVDFDVPATPLQQ